MRHSPSLATYPGGNLSLATCPSHRLLTFTKKGPLLSSIIIDYLCHAVVPHDDGGSPHLRWATAIRQDKDFCSRIDDCLTILWNRFKTLVSTNRNSAIFAAQSYPFWIRNAFMLTFGIDVEDMVNDKPYTSKSRTHSLSMSAVQKDVMSKPKTPFAQSIQLLCEPYLRECRNHPRYFQGPPRTCDDRARPKRELPSHR